MRDFAANEPFPPNWVETAWLPPESFDAAEDGSHIDITMVPVDSVPLTARVSDIGSQGAIAVDYTAIGAITQSVEVYDGGTLVATVSGHSRAPVIVGDWPVGHASRSEGVDEWFFSSPTTIEVPATALSTRLGSAIGPGTLRITDDPQMSADRSEAQTMITTGDLLCFRAEDAVDPPTIIEEGRFRLRLIDPFTITTIMVSSCSESSEPQPERLARQGDPVSIKIRILSVKAGDEGRLQIMRVTLTSLPSPFDSWNDAHVFVGEPRQVCENSGKGLNVGPPDCGSAPGRSQAWFWAAPLVCSTASAAQMDWTTLENYCTVSGEACETDDDCAVGTCGVDGIVHLYGAGIVPSRLASSTGPIAIPSQYAVQIKNNGCCLNNEEGYSPALLIDQAGWGDVTINVSECPNGPPDESISVLADAVAILNKFSNRPCAVKKSRADLEPCSIDLAINITDVMQSLAAFTGEHYPCLPGPTPCANGN